MAGLYVYRSNRMEILVDLLAQRLASAPLRDPFAAEQIVVGNHGMEQWLSRQLAHRLGICANIRFSLPGEVLDSSLDLLSAEPAAPRAVDPWSTDALTWGVLACLEQLLEDPTHAEAFRLVRSYLERDVDAGARDGSFVEVTRHRYALARQIADLFDRYVVFRPRWARAWSAGRPAPGLELPASLAWQPLLWRALQQRLGGPASPHLAERVARAHAVDEDPAPRPPAPRLAIFGVSSLPPIYLEVLDLRSRLGPVELYLLCPSPEYWEDLISRGEQAARRRRMARDELTHHLRHDLEQAGKPDGAPLLASLGRIARDFQVVLEALPQGYQDCGGPSPEGLFVDPVCDSGLPMGEPATALRWLQSDIYNVRHPAPQLQQPGVRRRQLRPTDDSLQCHACHGPTRQVEVLRDVLLGLLADHGHLQPRDVVVMTPEIEVFAPLVSAVFDEGRTRRRERDGHVVQGAEGWGPTGAPRIPYRVADLSLRRTNPVADALLRVLELAGGRMEASAVLDLLGLEPVQLRFGLQEDEMPQLQEWIRKSGIRWALDRAHRRAEGLPDDDANTWRFGLQRLVLGATMAGGHRLVQGVAPYDDMEGAQVELLGRFLDFCATLDSEMQALRRARPVSRWADQLEHTLRAICATSARAAWLSRRVRDTLAELQQQTLEAPVELEAMRSHLEGRFELASERDVNPGGAVTFCALVPMRSIPHAVVCLLGMDEDAFPRNPGSVGFDLTSSLPVVGDRDPRDEDRLLLLEALLAAREHLVVLYTGHDVHTNKERAPAAPITELLDVVDQSFPPPRPNLRPSHWITTHHRLQAFSPENFKPLHRNTGGEGAALRPWSFDRRLRDAAARLQRARLRQINEPEPFVTYGAGPPAQQPQPVELQQLIEFFQHPIKHLLQKGLQLNLDEQVELVQDREPIELDGLERWQLANELLCPDHGASVEQMAAMQAAQGRLPLGTAGAVLHEQQRELADAARELAAQQHQGLAALPELQLDPRLVGVQISGRVPHRWGDRCVLARVGSADEGRRFVAPWIYHLAWRAQQTEEDSHVVQVLVRRTEQTVTRRVFEFRLSPAPGEHPAEYARRRLQQLVQLYHRGMREPIRLLPLSSYTFAKQIHDRISWRHKHNDPPPQLLEDQRQLGEACYQALKVWRRRTYHESPRGDADDLYVAQVHGDHCPLTVDGSETGRRPHPDFVELALQFWWPLLQARHERRVP